MLKRFISYYKPVRKLFFFDMVCSFSIALINMVYPMISRNMVQKSIPDANVHAFLMACLLLLVLFSAKKFMNYFIQYKGHVVGVRMQANMRQEAFDHLQKLPFSYFDENKTGTIMSRIINDLMDISELAHHGPEDLFTSCAMLIGSFIILCMINVPLTLIIFAIIPFLMLFAIKKRKRLSETQTRTRIEVGEVNAGLDSSIGGLRVSRAFGGEAHESKKFRENNGLFVAARTEAYKAMAEFYSGTYYILDLLTLLALGASGYFVLRGWITIADFLAYVLYISMFSDPIKKLVNFMETAQSGMTGFKRFCELIDEPEEWGIPEAKPLTTEVKGNIEFENVSFSYDMESEIFTNISLEIKAGETVAFVGPSGSGKTTLCHLIPRFYNVDSGKILLDGEDVTYILRPSLREKIGIVQQDTFLFGGSIRENIAFGNFSASEEEIIEAAKKANIHDYILTLPHGYETEVGERGVKLSGGQKQRISIARVFLKNPSILILDEATSALDNTTELLIQESLEELSEGRTALIVAHRLSTIRRVDRIFVITKEGVEEQGTHEELMKRNGLYASLYNIQFELS